MMDQSHFIEKMARKITELGLTAPAIFLLEAHKPLAFIGSQLILVAQPTLDILWPRNSAANMADLLADPSQLDQLMTRLERLSSHNAKSGEIGS